MNKPIPVVLILAAMAAAARADFNPFADAVVDTSLNAPNPPAYLPAPGQFVNDDPGAPYSYSDPAAALGAPSGGGTATPDHSSVVSLGGFGGQLTLAFDHDVADSPANPMGLDAAVFSNTVWPFNDPQLHWAELATIEIMPEVNASGVPGDDPAEKWYPIPGSHLPDASTHRTATWDRSDYAAGGDYPEHSGWPDSYQTFAYELFPTYRTIGISHGVLVNPDAPGDTEGYYGYAEYTPTLKLGDRDGDNSTAGAGDDPAMAAELFYTTPDDPLAVGVTPGSGGGDAFDIAWAVDPDTWQPAGLSSFRYVRLTTAVDAYIGALGEISPEIDAVADVRMVCDLDGDDVAGHDDYDAMQAAIGSAWSDPGYVPTADIVADGLVDGDDWQAFLDAWTALYVVGDANLDGWVDGTDLGLMSGAWGSTDGSWRVGDFNGDRTIDGTDLGLMSGNWGAGGGGSPPVPEPATAASALVGLALLMAGRNRSRRARTE
jgi:hypothetical protein